jgi:hypothetical protein
VDGDVGVFESDGHAAQVLLGETDDGLQIYKYGVSPNLCLVDNIPRRCRTGSLPRPCRA